MAADMPAEAAAAPPCPRDAASPLGRYVFRWLTPLYSQKGADLADQTDAASVFHRWPLPAVDQPELNVRLMQEAWDAAAARLRESSGSRHAPEVPLDALIRGVFRRRWVRSGLWKALGLLSIVLTPLLIKSFLEQVYTTARSAPPPWRLSP